jgi:hypothetical protein
MLMYNKKQHFSWLCRLLSRHAITCYRLTRYGVFSGYDGYRADMRNTNSINVLWQIRSSDYPADMRNSSVFRDLWLSRFFLTGRGVRAPAQLVHRLAWSHENRLQVLTIMTRVMIAHLSVLRLCVHARFPSLAAAVAG